MRELRKLDSTLFTWQRWRAGSIDDFCIPCREDFIIRNSSKLREYAVGYCNGNRLITRCKPKEMAVMFFFKGRHFWFHLRKKEFRVVYET